MHIDTLYLYLAAAVNTKVVTFLCFVRRALVVLSVVFIFPPTGYAESSATSSYVANTNIPQEEVVTTGTRDTKMVLDAPIKTELVTRADLEKNHSRNLKEALSMVPGLMIKKVHGKTGYEVWMQGVDSNRVLVLIDGMKVTASTGSTVDITQISAGLIERVEIIKGATSALYGSSAMGGVINVITRDVSEDFAAELTVDGGDYGDANPADVEYLTPMSHISAQIEGRQGPLSFVALFDNRDSDGYFQSSGRDSEIRDVGSKRTSVIRTNYKPTIDRKMHFQFTHYEEDVEVRSLAFSPPFLIPLEEAEAAERKRYEFGVSDSLSANNDYSLVMMYEEFRDYTERDSLLTPMLEKYRDASFTNEYAGFTMDSQLFENHLLSYGLQYEAESLEQDTMQFISNEQRFKNELDDERREGGAFFIQDEFSHSEWMEFLPGFRYQEDSNFGGHFSGKLNVVFHLNSVDRENHIRIGLGQGYRAPNLKELHFEFENNGGSNYKVIGNEDLQPESSDGVQIGWSHVLPQRFIFDLGYFYNEFENLIEAALDPQLSDFETEVLAYRNFEESTIQGIELYTNLKFGLFNGVSSTYDIAYTYLSAKDDLTGKHLPNRPRHLVKSSLEFDFAAIKSSWSLFYQWRDKEFTDAANFYETKAWANIDTKFNFYFKPTLTLFAGVDNVTNEIVDPDLRSDRRPEIGRMVYVGFKLSTDKALNKK